MSVALCTYNGQEYLQEQLSSIARQSILPSELVISDDHSTDATLSFIEQFSANAPFPVRISRNKRKTGVVANFSLALSACNGDYIALCDQDDIWLPDKLESDLLSIRKAEIRSGKTTPLLSHSDPVPVDFAGTPTADSFMRIRKLCPTNQEPLKHLLVQNYVTGCTIMMNRPLLEIALPIPGSALIHDWWLALVAAATGKIVFSEHRNVLYRQHGKNVFGATPFYAPENLKRIFELTKLEEEFAATIKQARSLLIRLQEIDGLQYPDYLEDYLTISARGGPGAGLYMIKNRILKTGLFRKLFQLLIILRKQYRQYL